MIFLFMSPGLSYYIFLYCLSFLLSFLPLFPYFSPPSRRSSHIQQLSPTNIVFIVRSNQGLYSTSTDRGFFLSLLFIIALSPGFIVPYFFFFPLSSAGVLVPSAYPFPQKSFLFVKPIERSVYSKYSYCRYLSKQILCFP